MSENQTVIKESSQIIWKIKLPTINKRIYCYKYEYAIQNIKNYCLKNQTADQKNQTDFQTI